MLKAARFGDGMDGEQGRAVCKVVRDRLVEQIQKLASALGHFSAGP